MDARGELNVAYEMFNSMGMESFAERARRELLATGATVHKRNVETRDDLTAQEAQIARLARDGLSNPEIGAQLFISAAHGRMASAQGVHEARHQLSPAASRGAVRGWPGGRERLTPARPAGNGSPLPVEPRLRFCSADLGTTTKRGGHPSLKALGRPA